MSATATPKKKAGKHGPVWNARTDTQARATLGRMRDLVNAAARNIDYTLWARDVIRKQGADLRDPRSVAMAVKDYVRNHLKFVRDPFGFESITPPLKQMEALRAAPKIAGDCDDAAVLAAGLGLACGVRAAMSLESFDWGTPARPNPMYDPFAKLWAFQHVFTTLLPPKYLRKGDRPEWIVNCDTTRSEQKLTPSVQRRATVLV